MIDYPLHEILLIAFLAVLANASTWTELEAFGRKKQKWLICVDGKVQNGTGRCYGTDQEVNPITL